METIFALHQPKVPFLIFPHIKNLVIKLASSTSKIQFKRDALVSNLKKDEDSFHNFELPPAAAGKHKHLLNAELSESQLATAFDLISLVELAPLKTKISQLEADLVKLQSEFLEDLTDLLNFTDFHPRPSEDGWTEFFSISFLPLLEMMVSHISMGFSVQQKKHLLLKNRKEEKHKKLNEQKSVPLVITEDFLVSKVKAVVSDLISKTKNQTKHQKNPKKTQKKPVPDKKVTTRKKKWTPKQGNARPLQKAQEGASISKKRAQVSKGGSVQKRR